MLCWGRGRVGRTRRCRQDRGCGQGRVGAARRGVGVFVCKAARRLERSRIEPAARVVWGKEGQGVRVRCSDTLNAELRSVKLPLHRTLFSFLLPLLFKFTPFSQFLHPQSSPATLSPETSTCHSQAQASQQDQAPSHSFILKHQIRYGCCSIQKCSSRWLGAPGRHKAKLLDSDPF